MNLEEKIKNQIASDCISVNIKKSDVSDMYIISIRILNCYWSMPFHNENIIKQTAAYDAAKIIMNRIQQYIFSKTGNAIEDVFCEKVNERLDNEI